MNAFFKQLMNIIKKETVLSAAFMLAAISSFIVPPGPQYFSYIDWNTLLLLFSLMAVMAGFQKLGVFRIAGSQLLSKTVNTRQLLLILVFLPFFFSMFITNDVALITFVPFAIIVLRLSGQEKLLVPLVVMQTIAANLGSMLTPMGNPQNLYLYAKSGMPLMAFLQLMLPYTIASGLCLLSVIFIMKSEALACNALSAAALSGTDMPAGNNFQTRPKLICFCIGFLLCLLCVAKVLTPIVPAVIIFLYLLFTDKTLLKKVDYSLLGTFLCFFIFIGNMGNIERFCTLLENVITGHERIITVLASQIISNVPAALLLSGFTDEWHALIIGSNLGGLGTLIASMASLISYKQIAKEYPESRKKYFQCFTFANAAMLAVLLVMSTLIS
ncbi:MAG: citrate transporter [Lachnospiraceae bacterium]|nr:citrate transporter [Lachnospiraceae bacterium]